MILENIKIYSQNICKNNFIIYTILKTHSSFNIIFIQEPSQTFIFSILSPSNYNREELVGVPNHSNWITFSKNLTQVHNSPRVIIYINICIVFLYFSLCNDFFNHRVILCVSFFNCSLIYYLINVYSDLSQSALKYLKDTEVNLKNVLIITGNFNIKDNFQNPNFPYYSSHRNTLFDIANSFCLEISKPIEFLPTRYSNNV